MINFIAGKVEKSASFKTFSDSVKKLTPGANTLQVKGLPGSALSCFTSLLSKTQNKIVLFFEDDLQISETKVELSDLGFSKSIIEIDDLSKEVLQEKLTELCSRENYILLTNYRILQIPLPDLNKLTGSSTKIEIGGDLGYDNLLEYFDLLGYNRQKFVESSGDFSIRGSIIDFWSFSEKQPCRLEFDGDFLESIRYFEPETQRSTGTIKSVTIASSVLDETDNYSTGILGYIKGALLFASGFELESMFKKTKDNQINEIDADDIDDELKTELFESNKPVHIEDDEITENSVYKSKEELLKADVNWILTDELDSSGNRIDLKITEAPAINSNFELLFNVLQDYNSKGFEIVITAENQMQAKRLTELLSDYNQILADLIISGKIKIDHAILKKGFVLHSEKLLTLSEYQIFNKPFRTKFSSKAKYKKSKARDLSSIKYGDFVVHETFGIGRYEGLETIKIGMTEQECIKIIYAEGGVVYVNLNYLALVKKYSSNDNVPPKLSVLGGGEWAAAKKKVKAKIKESARDLIILYAKRKASKGYAFAEDTIWQKELEASFLYEDTPDQIKITEDVKSDMECENPMDRLVCGDVGFGKTEIAVRAAFKAATEGKQVALMVPTTILAEQHYNTFSDRLSQFPVRVSCLSRFQTKSDQTKIVEMVKNGQTDIVIGTHRILSNDVKFKALGLLIIDEEHRFGVMAKEKLRAIKANVDTLALTATPIPRTLNLSLLGARDLSIMGTPPPNRQPINTKLELFDIVKIRQWILEEIHRDGQVYFVHDRVQSIEKIAFYLQKHIPEIKIGIAHGQMRPAQLEDVIHSFLHKKYNVLIATKIIESGLDIPNVNTIIINRADRFGLAELHQLRGRVGRSARRAFAYLLVPSLKSISKTALKRLQAIEEFTDLGGGFNLSMRDLEIRGAGNLLGTEQSGSIDAVGFEMYIKLLDEAVEELKISEFKDVFKNLPKHRDKTEPTIDTFFEVGIPDSYMPDQADRLSYYTLLFSLKNINEIDEIQEEITDRFGKIPPIIDRLINTAILRFYASYAMFERIVITAQKISLILPKGEKEEYYQTSFSKILKHIMEKYQRDVNFIQNKDVMKLEMKNTFKNPETVLSAVTAFCKEISELLEAGSGMNHQNPLN
ncbi:MAG: transcription-repair coupling factor [Ignavibacteria bacterium]|nr:transcription-repair coupling factor [Ignavibacteria bacterium]